MEQRTQVSLGGGHSRDGRMTQVNLSARHSGLLLRYNKHSDRNGRLPCHHVLELLLTSSLFHKYY